MRCLVDVRAEVLKQALHHIEITSVTGSKQAGVTNTRCLVDVSTVLNQVAQYSKMPVLGSHHERKSATISGLTHIGAVLADQTFHDLEAALLGCHEQGSGPVRPGFIDVSAELYEAVNEF